MWVGAADLRFRCQLFCTGPVAPSFRWFAIIGLKRDVSPSACSPLDRQRLGMASLKARWWSREPGHSFGKEIAFDR
jgi:hypothetical protein